MRGSRISARAMATRWRWPPESWCGIAEAEARAEADLAERPLDSPVRLAAPREPVDGERLGQHPVHRVARVERAVGVLEDHLADARERPRRDARSWVWPATPIRPAAGRRPGPRWPAAPSIFPEPDSPTSPNAAPSATRKETSRTAWTRSLALPEDHVEPVDLEDRRRRAGAHADGPSRHAGSRSRTGQLGDRPVDARQRAEQALGVGVARGREVAGAGRSRRSAPRT